MKRVGILGGGQLGRMLLQAAGNYPAETFVMEKESDCPAASLCHHFQLGNIQDYDQVLAFGRKVDVLTIEIEQVNVDALEQLEREGVLVIPHPSTLRIIQNKIRQKEFYQQNQIPTAPFLVTQKKEELIDHLAFLPAVHKLGVGGYDGRGVTMLENELDLPNGFDAPAILEKKIPVKTEIAVLVAVGADQQSRSYPSVEMIFDQKLNLLNYQICPAAISVKIEEEARTLAQRVVRAFGSPGVFAVEMFVDEDDRVWVNEIAPRVHNSGHHTIEAHYSSQFDMLWRILMGLPLGNTDAILPSLMVNLVGAPGQAGEAVYDGLDEVLQLPNAFLHLYGKKETKPGRKMGHVTLLGNNPERLVQEASRIKSALRIRS
ncbi:MAG: 5-(carboxyamino)imidazole ribonucleotide synthase [Bacteroidota bacterium]